MTGRRQSFFEKWAPAHNLTVEEAMKKFPGNLFRFAKTAMPTSPGTSHRLFDGELVCGRPFFKERLPASGHHGAWYHAIDLYTVLDALLSECLSPAR